MNIFDNISFDGIIIKFYLIFAIVTTIYSVLKEREEFGCTKLSVKRQCNKLNSIYLRGTLPDVNDTRGQIEFKLLKLLSVHEISVVWRKSFILSTAICIFIKLFSDVKPNNLVALHIVIIAILYFYLHFMNFHIYKLIKQVGSRLIIGLRDIKDIPDEREKIKNIIVDTKTVMPTNVSSILSDYSVQQQQQQQQQQQRQNIRQNIRKQQQRQDIRKQRKQSPYTKK
jgi:hypothetical protein